MARLLYNDFFVAAEYFTLLFELALASFPTALASLHWWLPAIYTAFVCAPFLSPCFFIPTFMTAGMISYFVAFRSRVVSCFLLVLVLPPPCPCPGSPPPLVPLLVLVLLTRPPLRALLLLVLLVLLVLLALRALPLLPRHCTCKRGYIYKMASRGRRSRTRTGAPCSACCWSARAPWASSSTRSG
jgi:hypothetical protein